MNALEKLRELLKISNENEWNDFINQLGNEIKKQETPSPKVETIGDVLVSIGITPNIMGFKAIEEALTLVCQNPDYLHGITTKLIPEVARQLSKGGKNISPRTVERNITGAIETSYRQSKPQLEKLFQTSLIKAPSNGRFIAVLSHYCKSLM